MTDLTTPRSLLSRRRLLGYGIIAGVAVLGYSRWRLRRPDYAGGSLDVHKAHAQAASGEVLLIDIRRPDEWTLTGIGEGAVPLDMRRADFENELKHLADGDTTRPIALICARGVRSARMSGRLTEAGFTNIIDVPEGMLGSSAGPGWLAQALPVTPYAGVSG